MNLFHWNSQSRKGFRRGVVGDNPKFGLSCGPKTVNRNGVSYDCDELKAFTKGKGETGYEVSIYGKGKNDDFGAMDFDQLAYAEIGRLVDKNCFFDQRKVVAGDIKEIPKLRITVDQGKVEATKKIVYAGPRFCKRIRYDGVTSALVDSTSQSACSCVVTIPKSSGEDQDGG